MEFEEHVKQAMTIMSILALPVAISVLGRILYFGIARKFSLFETVTLLILQLNSVFMWLCNLQAPFYTIKLDSKQSYAIYCMFYNAQYIAPVTTFLYSWRFLQPIEEGLLGGNKMICRWFRLVSVWLFPLVFYALFSWLVIAIANVEIYLEQLKLEKSHKWSITFQNLTFAISVWTCFANLISCLILIAAFLQVRKIIQKQKELTAHESDVFKRNIKVSSSVFIAHVIGILLIIAFTVSTVLTSYYGQ